MLKLTLKDLPPPQWTCFWATFEASLSSQVSLQKQALEKEVDTLKEKQKWTEGQLQESQNKEAQTHTKLMVTHTHIHTLVMLMQYVLILKEMK